MSVYLERRFLAAAAELKAVRDQVREAAERAGASQAEAADVVLAVDEACQNVIRHAYEGDAKGDLEIRLAREGAALIVELRDFASAVDPECVHRQRDLDELRAGGLGTHFMRSVMDDVGFLECSERGNLLRMTKRLER